MKKAQPNPTPQAAKVTMPANRNFVLSLIIPCYNESKRTDIMLEGLAEFDEKWKGEYEAIIVDDGSRDDTAAKIEEALTNKYSSLKGKVRLEKMPVNRGKGSALKYGVSQAKGDYVLTLDADMSTRPTELLNWQKKEKDIFSTEDTVYIGSRRHEEGKVEALKSRRFIGGVFNGMVQVFTSLRLKDTQCGFKLYPKSAATLLFGNMQSKGWEHDVELLYQADLNDYKIVEMPINWVNQPESKVNVVKDSFMMFLGVLAISLRIWLYNTFVLPFKIPPTANDTQRKHIQYRAIFNVLAILLLIVMPIMSFQYAVTGDEHWHFDYGNDIYNYFFHGDNTAQTATSGIQYYGGLFDFITASVYHIFHFWDHYTTMHFINALVGAIGIIFAGKLARLLTGNWNAGILAVVFLVLSPSWFGHNFANPKDIPFSVGYTAGIYYIILFIQSLPNPSFKHLLGLVLSIGWAMGVRIGGFLLIAYLVLFIGSYAVLMRQLKTILNLRLIKHVIIVSIAGYIIAIVCWPYAHLGIINKPLEALTIFSHFFINIGLLYEGKKIFSNQIPWYYIPKYVMYTAPIIVLVGFAIGCVSLPVVFRKNFKGLLFSLFVLFTCVFPVAYAIYQKSSLYDGWRHFLFVYPPLVILASVGLTSLMSRQAVVKYAVLGLIVVGLISPVRFAIANHTFESLYYNEVPGGLKNMYGKYETDYYMLGIKPATEWLLANEHLQNKKVVISTNCVNPLLAYLYLGHYKTEPYKYEQPYERLYERTSQFVQDPATDSFNKIYASMYPGFMKDTFPVGCNYVKAFNRYSKDWDYAILFSRDEDPSRLTSGNWPPPETIYTVKVDGVPIAAVLKRRTKKDLAGFQAMKAKNLPAAKEAFLASLLEYPDNELVWEALAEIYDAEGNSDSAIYAGYKTLAHYPGDLTAYQIMGNAYLKARKIDSAMSLYEKLAPYNASFSHYLKGYAYAVSGNGSKAFNEIDAAIEADKYNQQAYNLGIKLAQQMKDQGKAEDYYERAKKAFPEKEEK